MRNAQLAMAAMNAGLRGERLPDLGRLTKEELGLVNSVYDEARNFRASGQVKTRNPH